MAVALAWLDHDPAARERVERILALFEERGTRDELGLGGIRDAFSDRLFPGTSTIQTRLRYMFFVPWMYAGLEAQHTPAQVFAERARRIELDISRRLLAAGDESGVFGRVAGRKLQRLASSVYWGGLGTWGIRLFRGSQQHYHRVVDILYRQRRELAATAEDGSAEPSVWATWHPGLPPAPEDFPESATLVLTRTEAEFIRERVEFTHPESFLAHLFRRGEPTDCVFPWEHPAQASASVANVETLQHARLFSETMFGAALLYNLLLAEQDERAERIDQHAAGLTAWEQAIDRSEVARWDLDRMWCLVQGQGHTITSAAKAFVSGWVKLVLGASGSLRGSAAAADLICRREVRLKGPERSRFKNRLALERWSGSSGLARYDYRWGTVTRFLDDLQTGLAS